MINFEVTYIKNKKTAILEQAAGFPPFTRGYSTVSRPTKISVNIKSEFSITDYTDESIIELFNQIILRQVKKKISLGIPFSGIVQEVIYIRVLRTLLAFISDQLYDNPTETKFEFIGEFQNPVTSLNSLVFANAAQLDTLVVNNKENWEPIKELIPHTPVDSLYGSSDLENETSTIFFRLWKQIENLLT